METRNEKEEVDANEEEDRTKKKEIRESAIPGKLVYLGLKKPTLKEIRENPDWLRLVKKYTYIQERRQRRKSVKLGQPREREKLDREG